MDAPFPVVDEHMDAQAVARLLTRDNPAVLVRRGGARRDRDALRYGAFSHEVRDARGAQRGGDLPAAPDCCTGATGALRGMGRVRVA